MVAGFDQQVSEMSEDRNAPPQRRRQGLEGAGCDKLDVKSSRSGVPIGQ
jgi:hypothetical protein